MADVPTDIVTFAFMDIEGATTHGERDMPPRWEGDLAVAGASTSTSAASPGAMCGSDSCPWRWPASA